MNKYRENSHLTAIKRGKISAPARWVRDQGLLMGRVLDFGCGKGEDADILDCDRYDPKFFPERPYGTFNTILCTYVLNVLPQEDEKTIVKELRDLLWKDGRAYVTVRRDLDADVCLTKRGTLQRNVILTEPVAFELRGRYCVYVIAK